MTLFSQQLWHKHKNDTLIVLHNAVFFLLQMP